MSVRTITKQMFETYLDGKRQGHSMWGEQSLLVFPGLERDDLKHIILNFISLKQAYDEGKLPDETKKQKEYKLDLEI